MALLALGRLGVGLLLGGALTAVLSSCAAPAAKRPGHASSASAASSSASSTAPSSSSSAGAAPATPTGGTSTSPAGGTGTGSPGTAGTGGVSGGTPSGFTDPAIQGPALKIPLAVIVDNSPAARPQAGLDQAEVVWEVLAEGFITRFLALFTHASATIGPVRSTRIYFDQLDHAYGLPLAHAGGSVDGLDWIGGYHLQNLDAIYGAGAYFYRSSSRKMPDNLYTSSAALERAAEDRGFKAPSPRLPEAGPLGPGAESTSSVTLSYYDDPQLYVYVVGWRWQGDAWQRTVNGQDQIATDGRPVRAGTVLVLVVPTAPDPNDHGNPLTLYMLWSKGGSAWVLRSGMRTRGTWSMGADGLPIVREHGAIVPAGSGPYWYELVPTSGDVSFN